jgi:hypothetical protein
MAHRLPTRTTLLATCALAVLALAAPSAQAAVRFKGETSQGLGMFLKVSEDGAGEVTRAAVNWRGDCRNENFRFRARTGFVAPHDVSTSEVWRDGRTYDEEHGDGFSTTVEIHIHGHRVSESRWKGAFRAVATVFRDGEQITRCPTGKVRWAAERP